ncbi:MAG TPA: hypothetical protein VKA46_07695 [Gemmataceae bacterium]|nr:hypothetical protein [Gemmataceae bacterium]
MTTKERIQAAIDTIGDEDLDELYSVIRNFAATKAAQPTTGIMAKLKGIKIEAPADFAANLDQYASGEKRVEDNLH